MSDSEKQKAKWYTKSKDSVSGPYNYYQVISQINTGKVSINDHIRNGKLGVWKKFQDCEDFHFGLVSNSAASIPNKVPKCARKHKRHEIIADVFLKKNNELIKGKVIEISKGGMGIEAEDNFSDENGIVSVFVSLLSEFFAFNCHVKVTSKIKLSGTKCRYGVQFLRLSEKGDVFLKKIIEALEELEKIDQEECEEFKQTG